MPIDHALRRRPTARAAMSLAVAALAGCATPGAGPPLAWVDVTHGPLPASATRTIAYPDAASCLRALARLRAEARRIERRRGAEQSLAFDEPNRLSLDGHLQRRLRHHRFLECNDGMLVLSEYLETPNVPPPDPPPPPPPPPPPQPLPAPSPRR